MGTVLLILMIASLVLASAGPLHVLRGLTRRAGDRWPWTRILACIGLWVLASVAVIVAQGAMVLGHLHDGVHAGDEGDGTRALVIVAALLGAHLITAFGLRAYLWRAVDAARAAST